jgi:peptide/nickel transport system permease protein
MDRSSHKTSVLEFFTRPRALVSMLILGIFVFVSVFAPFVAPFDPSDLDLMRRMAAPSWQHLLGCDLNGADVLSIMIYGGRASLYIALATVLLSVSVGMSVGLLSGYFGGVIDMVLMRLVDIVMAIPGILVAMVLATLLGPSLENVILAIAATGWTSSARITRAQVLSVKEREFVLAHYALGASHLRLMLRHILPQILSPIIVHGTFSLAGVVIIESSLSFLGLSSQTATWGSLLGQGRTVMEEAPHLTWIPGMALLVVVLCLNFLGDELRDWLDPKAQKS